MQIVYIDLIPQKEKPIVYASQFDNNRSVRFMLTENGNTYTLAGTEDVTCEIRKPDGNIVIITLTIGANSYVDVDFTEQACACYGRAFGELSIKDNDDVIGTCNFILDVEVSPTAGGIQSASDIDNLTAQIEAIAQAEGYLKSDDVAPVALSGDYNDLINKPTIPTKTSDLVNDSDFVDEDTVDDKINDFGDQLLDLIIPIDSASGNPCTFDTGLANPLVGCKATLVSTGGNGTPSTPIPIVGYNVVNLNVNGTTHTISLGSTYYGGVLDVKNGKLTVTKEIIDLGSLGYGYSTSYTNPIFYANLSSDYKGFSNSICSCYVKITDVSVSNFSQNASNYQFAFNNVSWGQLFIRNDDYTDGNAFQTAMAGQKVIFELATPVEVDVTPEQISALLGVNNITSDAVGDVEVKFRDSIQHYIDVRT